MSTDKEILEAYEPEMVRYADSASKIYRTLATNEQITLDEFRDRLIVLSQIKHRSNKHA